MTVTKIVQFCFRCPSVMKLPKFCSLLYSDGDIFPFTSTNFSDLIALMAVIHSLRLFPLIEQTV